MHILRSMLLLLLTFPLSGCLLELLTTTAIQGELAAENAQSATRALSYAKESVAMSEARHAISAYAAENGYYPASLDVLVPDYLYSVPTSADGRALGYNAQTGQITDPLAPTVEIPFTTADRKNLQALRDATYMFWESTGRYPASLGDLDPLYIAQVPLLSSGDGFIYDPVTGSVWHPAELAQQRQQATSGGQTRSVSGGGGGGAGPMGEVMTGIGIQNQSNSMNQSGV